MLPGLGPSIGPNGGVKATDVVVNVNPLYTLTLVPGNARAQKGANDHQHPQRVLPHDRIS